MIIAIAFSFAQEEVFEEAWFKSRFFTEMLAMKIWSKSKSLVTLETESSAFASANLKRFAGFCRKARA